MAVGAGCWWVMVKFRECGEVLWCRRFPVRPAVLYGSEAWCLKVREMGILRWTQRSMVRAMCGVQLGIEKDLIISY